MLAIVVLTAGAAALAWALWQYEQLSGAAGQAQARLPSVIESNLSKAGPTADTPQVILVRGYGGLATGSMLLFRSDPARDEISFLTVPRRLSGAPYSTDRPDAAAIARLIELLHRSAGVSVQHVALLDFSGISGIVDALGGITVANPSQFDVLLGDTRYVHFPAGQVELSGPRTAAYLSIHPVTEAERALREANELRVLQAVVNKLIQPSDITNLTSTAGTIAKETETDLDNVGHHRPRRRSRACHAPGQLQPVAGEFLRPGRDQIGAGGLPGDGRHVAVLLRDRGHTDRNGGDPGGRCQGRQPVRSVRVHRQPGCRSPRDCCSAVALDPAALAWRTRAGAGGARSGGPRLRPVRRLVGSMALATSQPVFDKAAASPDRGCRPRPRRPAPVRLPPGSEQASRRAANPRGADAGSDRSAATASAHRRARGTGRIARGTCWHPPHTNPRVDADGSRGPGRGAAERGSLLSPDLGAADERLRHDRLADHRAPSLAAAGDGGTEWFERVARPASELDNPRPSDGPIRRLTERAERPLSHHARTRGRLDGGVCDASSSSWESRSVSRWSWRNTGAPITGPLGPRGTSVPHRLASSGKTCDRAQRHRGSTHRSPAADRTADQASRR